MIWETLKKQRRTLRRSIGHIGTIQTEPDARPHYCIVMDDSEGGVRISIPHDFELSDKFNLRRYSGKEARYKVVWRKGRLIGAQLIGKRREQTTHSVVGAVLNTE
jgi:rRNA maturation protein Nop10